MSGGLDDSVARSDWLGDSQGSYPLGGILLMSDQWFDRLDHGPMSSALHLMGCPLCRLHRAAAPRFGVFGVSHVYMGWQHVIV